MVTLPEHRTLVLFDGVCNLCNRTIDFLIRADKKKVLRYASLQSETARELSRTYDFDPEEMSTVVVIHKGELYRRSDAFFAIADALGGLFNGLRLFKWIPRSGRDAIYRRVSRSRYRWFGKRDTCRLPSPEEQALFLD